MAEEKNKYQNDKVREHLANERTFLAWLRTSIAIMAFGFVVVKFTLFVKQISIALQKPIPVPNRGYAGKIGIFLVGLGVAIALFAFFHFRNTGKQISNSNYSPSYIGIILFAGGVVLTGILLGVYLLNNI